MRVVLLFSLLSIVNIGVCNFGEPIQTRNHRAASLIFLRMRPAPNVLNENEQAIDTSLTVANDFRRIGTIDEDAEITRLGVIWKRGVGNGREVSVEIPVLSRNGGFLDPIIDSWHKSVLGWSDPVREATPFGRSVIKRAGAYSFGSATGIGDVSVQATQQINPRLSVSFGLKMPTGDSDKLLGSGAIDVGMSTDFKVPLRERLTLFAHAGLVAQSSSAAIPAARGLVDQEALSLVFLPWRKEAWVIQWSSERAPVTTGISPCDATHRIITFGYQKQVSPNRMLELYISEDKDLFDGRIPELASVGPDFTFGIRYLYRY